MADLTPAEQQFFATGELPAELTQPSIVDRVALAGVGETSTPTLPVDPTSLVVTPPTPAAPTPATSPDVAELLRQSLAEAQQRAANLEAQLSQLNQVSQQPVEAPAPDPNIDPIGAMLHQLNTVNKNVAELQTKLQQQQNLQQQTTQFQQFQQHVQTLRDQFMKTAPDFYDAYTHLRDSRTADLRALGLQDNQIHQALLQDEVALAEGAIRSGRNPAEVAYEMAKRHGYVAKTQGTPAPTPAARLSNIQQTPTNLPPATPNMEDVTLDNLKNASDADLNKYVMNEAIWSKIAGKDQYPL